ncbi:hypothetical protein JAAARDRAFT_212075 [Jaapia argillacea MUCL 33604]|uniref:O-methyltransferase C-terminal domain-containing protein n=1 Tax=Jaapia argillacea MUCL 33604 TaxID=933084 RepID=A0A067P449_9AGAM|nr:hypothetical protein JAAARDRAFT_212075 [Jaapia argillacea MUCL 33604]
MPTVIHQTNGESHAHPKSTVIDKLIKPSTLSEDSITSFTTRPLPNPPFDATGIDTAHLTDLLSLITSAVGTVISEYNAIGHRVPALSSTLPGPFDTPDQASPTFTKAIQVIEGACAQLCATVAGPGHTMINYEESACLQIVTSAKISDYLLDKPDGLHVSDLSLLSGLEADKLSRVLRRLATVHCYCEVKPNVFANNRLSMKLLSSDPVGSYVGHVTDECMKAGTYLADTLQDLEVGHSQSPDKAAFPRVLGCGVFDYYTKHKEHGDRFNKAMVGWGRVTGKTALVKAYPWSELPKDTLICDVGGGNGHRTLELVKASPQLMVVVQDLEATLWTKEYPEVVKEDRVAFVPLDFFNGVPVKDCDIYYLSHVLHDWPDAECIKILCNIRKAMKATSRILVHDYVLQHAVRTDMPGNQELAPEPLLPNYGAGKVRGYNLDLNMMAAFNGKERTLDDFINLGNRADLRFVRMCESGETGLVEFCLP